MPSRPAGCLHAFPGHLKEALSLSDRIAVMFRGHILEIISGSDTI